MKTLKNENLKIALVHDRLIKWGGAELVLEIFHKMFPDAPIFTLVHNNKGIKSRLKDADIRTSFIQKFPNPAKFYNFYLPLLPRAIESFDFSEFDLVISICHSFSKGIITKGKTKHICYLLTPTRFLWHQQKEALENKGLITRTILRMILSYLKKWDIKAAKRPDQYVSISQCVKDRANKYYGRENDIIYPPVETERFGKMTNVRNYFLIVSRLESHKKIDLAVKTFNELGWPLKIIGTGLEEEKLKKMAKNNIDFLGELSDNKVVDYYQNCKAFLYPQEEDFGITALEAQASGKPVIAYRAGGALDTVKSGETGEFFCAQTPESLIAVLKKFNPEKYDAEKIKKWAEQFSVERFKKEWIKYLEK